MGDERRKADADGGEARNLTDGMTRHRPAIAKTRTSGQGATNRPNQTDETWAESKHAVGNARDGEHGAKRGRDPTTTTETRPGKQEKTRHERKTRTSGKTKANERSARERHDTIKASKPPSRPQPQIVLPFAHPTPGGGGLIEARKQERTRMRGKGEREKSPEPPPRNDEAANAVSVMESE